MAYLPFQTNIQNRSGMTWVRDGNKDCNNGIDTLAYQSSPEYLGHSKCYQQGYNDAVNKCSSTPDTTTPQPTLSQSQPDCKKLGLLGGAIGGLAGSLLVTH